MRFASCLVSLLLSFLLAVSFTSCDGSSGQTGKIGRVDVIYGADQCTVPGEEFERDIRVEIRGVADSESASAKKLPLLSGEPVKFVTADGSDLEITPLSEETDVVGVARAKIRAGHKVGDNYVKIVPLNDPDKSVLPAANTGGKRRRKSLTAGRSSRIIRA